MSSHTCDVAIVGGRGAAGLSAALVLARSRRRVVVLDAGHATRLPSTCTIFSRATVCHPADLLAVKRAEVLGYGAEIVSATAVRVKTVSNGFEVVLDSGPSLSAGRVLIAAGLTDAAHPLRGGGTWTDLESVG